MTGLAWINASEAEAALEWQLRATGLPAPVPEHRFAPPRRWRFDMAWPDVRVAVEIDGATWTRGRHVRGAGYRRDAEKLNRAALDGWTVGRFTPDMVDSGEALAWVAAALTKSGPPVSRGPGALLPGGRGPTPRPPELHQRPSIQEIRKEIA